MLKANKVSIGVDEYVIMHNTSMRGTHLGSINPNSLEIRLREVGYDNSSIAKKTYYKVLMHEIVHGIDFNVLFVDEDKDKDYDEFENAIDLVAVYIIKHLRTLMEKREECFSHFLEYVNACEFKSKRLELLFYGVLDFINDNPELVSEFLELYEN